MRNTGNEPSVKIATSNRVRAERRQAAMKSDRVAWFRWRKST